MANIDSICCVEWFIGGPSQPGRYEFDVLNEATSEVITHGEALVSGHGWQWARCDCFTYKSLCFTKGKNYILKVSHSGGDSVNYVCRTDNPYQYAAISARGGQLRPPPGSGSDLVARFHGRMNAANSSYWAILPEVPKPSEGSGMGGTWVARAGQTQESK